VFDPDKMGTDLFHCFHNAPFLMSDQGYRRIEPQNAVTFDRDLYNQYKKDWFTLIKPGASLKRTVTAKGYPVIPPGSYRSGFAFGSPGTGFTQDKQAQFDAPVWIGQMFMRGDVVVPEGHSNQTRMKPISDLIQSRFPPSPGNHYVTVQQCDETPTVKVGTSWGYRMVCSWKRPIQSTLNQQTSFDHSWRQESIELVLFPDQVGRAQISADALP